MGYWRLIRVAFSARPWGMLVPPNWLAIGAFALLWGWLDFNLGLGLIGAGLELAYLFALANHPRFHRAVAAQDQLAKQRASMARIQGMLGKLEAAEQKRFGGLQARCRAILEEHREQDKAASVAAQADSLSQLLFMYLRLLTARASIGRLLAESPANLPQRIRELERQAGSSVITPELRASLQGQIDILMQRQARQAEARDKVALIEAELARVEQQVELVREAMAVSADPEVMARQVDEIGASLRGTTQWMRQQSELLGQVDDVMNEPPPSLLGPIAEKQ